MSEKGIGLLEPGTGEKPEDFRFPENQDSKTPPQELDPAELKEISELLDSKDPGVSAIAEARINALGFPNVGVFREFNFYQDRFQGMADRHNKRADAKGISGTLDRVADKYASKNTDKPSRPKKIANKYVMQEQAERENLDFDRRLEEERREWDERLKLVIEALRAKRDDPEGEGKKRRVLIYGLGGGMRGPYGAGQVAALNEMGFTAEILDENDALVGSSAGFDDLIYYADGLEQTYKGASIYYEECTTKEFLDMTNAKQVMNIHVVGQAMRKGEKKLDTEHLHNLKVQIHAVVNQVDGADAELVDVKTATPDMISAAEASMNVRLLKAPGIEVNGKHMEDGSFGSFPIQKLIDKFQPTDILVLPNIPFRKITELAVANPLLDRVKNEGTIGLIKKFLKIESELRKMLEEFKEHQGVNIGIMWPPDRGLDTIDADADLIKTAVVDTVRDTIKQFGEIQPEKIRLYESERFRKPEEAAA